MPEVCFSSTLHYHVCDERPKSTSGGMIEAFEVEEGAQMGNREPNSPGPTISPSLTSTIHEHQESFRAFRAIIDINATYPPFNIATSNPATSSVLVHTIVTGRGCPGHGYLLPSPPFSLDGLIDSNWVCGLKSTIPRLYPRPSFDDPDIREKRRTSCPHVVVEQLHRLVTDNHLACR